MAARKEDPGLGNAGPGPPASPPGGVLQTGRADRRPADHATLSNLTGPLSTRIRLPPHMALRVHPGMQDPHDEQFPGLRHVEHDV